MEQEGLIELKQDDDDLVMGVDEIELYTKKDYLEIINLKRDFGFPLSKFGGRPCISRKAVVKWLGEWVGDIHIPFESLTVRMLEKIEYRRNLSNMKGQDLEGIDTICHFVRHPLDVVLKWSREENSPIKKKDKSHSGTGYYANTKELLFWMDKIGLRRGHYTPAMRPTIRIDREGEAPEFM